MKIKYCPIDMGGFQKNTNSTRVDLQMLKSRFCSWLDIFSYLVHLQLRLSSIEVAFYEYCLSPFKNFQLYWTLLKETKLRTGWRNELFSTVQQCKHQLIPNPNTFYMDSKDKFMWQVKNIGDHAHTEDIIILLLPEK